MVFGFGLDCYELNPMDIKNFNEFLIGDWKWIVFVITAYLFHDSYFIYVEEAFITLNWKAH